MSYIQEPGFPRRSQTSFHEALFLDQSLTRRMCSLIDTSTMMPLGVLSCPGSQQARFTMLWLQQSSPSAQAPVGFPDNQPILRDIMSCVPYSRHPQLLCGFSVSWGQSRVVSLYGGSVVKSKIYLDVRWWRLLLTIVLGTIASLNIIQKDVGSQVWQAVSLKPIIA